jgi:hypothetical protein
MESPLGARELQEILKPLRDYANNEADAEGFHLEGDYEYQPDCEHCTFHVIVDDIARRLLATIRALQQPVTVSDDDVRACLDEFNDCAEMNSPETNMRAALETLAYRKSAPAETTLETMTGVEAKAALRSLGLEGVAFTLSQRNAQGEKLQ